MDVDPKLNQEHIGENTQPNGSNGQDGNATNGAQSQLELVLTPIKFGDFTTQVDLSPNLSSVKKSLKKKVFFSENSNTIGYNHMRQLEDRVDTGCEKDLASGSETTENIPMAGGFSLGSLSLTAASVRRRARR